MTGESIGNADACEKMTSEDIVRAYASEVGFDLVGITSAEPFLRDEQAALERVRSGMMDGLHWYTEERVRRTNRPMSTV